MRHALEDRASAGRQLLRRTNGTRRDRSAARAATDVLPRILAANGFRGEPEDWAVLRTTRSETDAAVAVVGRNGREEVVVKLAGTAQLAARLEHEFVVLAQLADATSIAGTPLPKPIAAGELNGKHYLATHVLPGRNARTVPAKSMAQQRALAAAAAAITRFHAGTAIELPVDRARVESWCEPGLAALEAALGRSNRYLAALDAVREAIAVGLTGRWLRIGWAHGDYWLGNVLVDPGGASVTGIVDWDTAADLRLQLLDTLHLLLYTRASAADTQFGDVVVELVQGGAWLPHEEQILRQAAPEVLADQDLRTATLWLCWLEHVAANFEESPAYARSTIWMRRNVRQVLSAASAATPAHAAGTLVPGRPLPSPTRHTARRTVPRRPLAALRQDANVLLPISLVALACGLWAGAVRDIDVGHMTDVGLISVLPPSMFAALAALVAGFVIALRQSPLRQPLLLLHVVVLILIVFGTPALVEQVPRFAVTWRHVGIADFVVRSHSVDPVIDAYFNWPGFFGLLAFFDSAAGLKNALGFAGWVPVVFNLLYLGPLLLIFKTIFEDRRLVWLGVWFFYLTNWIGQDYLSPQGLSYFMYLALVALVLRWFVDWRAHPGRAGGGHPEVVLPLDAQSRSARPAQRVALVAVAICLFAALVPMHQLTPFAALAAITILVALRLCPLRGMPLLGAVLIATWLVFMANGFLAGHFGGLAGEVGDVSASVGSNVGTRISGSAGHLTVVVTRLLMTGIWWLLAVAGALRARRSRLPSLPFAALAVAPFPLMALQTYGGEILLRIYLFALPFTAFFVVMLFATTGQGTMTRLRSGRFAPVVLALVSSALVVSLLVARYGNERMDAFTQNEVRAAAAVYGSAPAGALVVAATTNMPWKFRHYEDYDVTRLTGLPSWNRFAVKRTRIAALVHQIRLLGDARRQPTYVILTDSQQAEIDLLQEGPRNVVMRLRRALEEAPGFQEIAAYPDAAVFVTSPRGRTRV